ncbi:MAG: TetR/AcrR family transcriptional regulator [Sphingomonadales bacterium]|nr:TetR/AcrR family transcriptional regulator [Sphingomonadales bacterium]
MRGTRGLPNHASRKVNPVSPRKISRPLPPEGAGSREAILLAALEAFARDGYDGASMPRIARIANVAPPLIHYYFGSKEKLWRETVGRSLGELRREADAINAATRGLAPLDRLRALLQAYCRFAARWPDHFFMIIAEARSDSARFAWVQENFTESLFDDIVQLLKDASIAGAIREVQPERVAITLIAGILLNFTVIPARRSGETTEEAANSYAGQLFEMLLHGIAAN